MESAPAYALADRLGLTAGRAALVDLSSSGFGATARLELDDQSLFVKHLPISAPDWLLAEADGLGRLAQTGSVAEAPALRVPRVHGLFEIEDERWLVLEWLSLQALAPGAAGRLGVELAEHHRRATAGQFGLERDNWIGATRQINTPIKDWATFLFEHRLRVLIDKLVDSGAAFPPDTLDRLREAWIRRFPDYQPVPSLLHGDLWSGNAAMLANGTPVVYDPAVHYGDRECDLAMAALFGGFGPEFFEAYEATWPLESGWEMRREFYQLYHVLNHALLFGGGYLSDARRRIERLLAG